MADISSGKYSLFCPLKSTEIIGLLSFPDIFILFLYAKL